jgi:thiamine biosynthesis lipoprotein
MDMLLSPSRRRLLGTLSGLGALTLAGCGKTPPAAPAAALRVSGHTMGTAYQLRLAGRAVAALSASQLQNLHADVQAAFDAVDRDMSLHRSGSELVRLNRHQSLQPVALSRHLFDVLGEGQRIAAWSGGAFDMTVAPLVQAWGFGPQRHATIPAEAQRDAGRLALGYQGVRLDPARRSVHKLSSAIELDLGSIAKGYGADLAARAIEAHGITDFMVEVGGEIVARGRNAQGQPWQIGIEEPDAMPRRARLVVPLSGAAMATSGDYRIYFEHAGRRYSHEIDPRTAEPIAHGLASVTVVAADAMRADALATALIVLGPQRGLALAERDRLAAHFIVRGADGRLIDAATPAFQALGARRMV